MIEFICLFLYIIAAFGFFIWIRLLDGVEQRERQMRVTRKRWLLRRLFYVIVEGVVCGSLLMRSAKLVFGKWANEIQIQPVQMWLGIVLTFMILVTVYYLVSVSGKLLLVYLGSMILCFGMVFMALLLFRLLSWINVTVLWCLLAFLIWLFLFLFYRKIFLRRDLGED